MSHHESEHWLISHCTVPSLLLWPPIWWQPDTQMGLWHLQWSWGRRGGLHMTGVHMLTADCGRQSFPKHLTQEHVDERVQTHVGGRQPQGGFFCDVERVLRLARTRHAASLAQSVGDAGKVKGGKAGEKHPHDHKDLCFGSAPGCLRSALWGFVWLIHLLADERVAKHHQGQRAPENNLKAHVKKKTLVKTHSI